MTDEHKGREQGTELGNEDVYTHPDHDREEVAYTATDRVNLEARGWVRKERTRGGSPRNRQSTGQGGGGDAAAASS